MFLLNEPQCRSVRTKVLFNSKRAPFTAVSIETDAQILWYMALTQAVIGDMYVSKGKTYNQAYHAERIRHAETNTTGYVPLSGTGTQGFAY